jgi:fucose 4-O-acetylase-like acetyltransferase
LDASLEKDKGKVRLEWLDLGKAAGILVVLLVHAGCTGGPVTFYGGMFYMPVFFVAAGYTYRCREDETYGAYLKKRARRLLLPYFGTSAFLWLFFWIKDSVLPGRFSDLKPLSVLGILYSRNQMHTAAYAGENPVLLNILNAPLWFLTAMFLICAWYGLISRSRKKYLLLALGALLSVLWHWGTGWLLPWSADAVPYFACFFAAGEALKGKKAERFLCELWILGLLLVVFLTVSRLNGSMNLSNGDYGHSMLLGLISGVSGSLLVFAAGMCLERKLPAVSRRIACVGQETLVILCFHMFLFMFLRAGAALAGLGEELTKAVLVGGSLILLTGAGRLRRMRTAGRRC